MINFVLNNDQIITLGCVTIFKFKFIGVMYCRMSYIATKGNLIDKEGCCVGKMYILFWWVMLIEK